MIAPGFAPKRAKPRGLGWLALGGALAYGCEAPYAPDLQTWPGDYPPVGTAGSAVQGTGGATGGSGGDGVGGSGAIGTGGISAGTGGSTTGGGGGIGGAGNVGGSATDGGSGGTSPGGAGSGGSGGAAGASATGGSGGNESVGGTANGGNGNVGGMANGGNGAGGRPSGGYGNAGAAGRAGSGNAGTGSSADCSLTVKVTTAPAGGRYAPRNIGAIWVADQSGNFVRSLEVWAQRRVNYLTLWNSATSKAGSPGNRVDIVSEATLSNHVAHTATWNCQDFNHKPVSDGTYRVYFEMTDSSMTGPNRYEQFSKGAAAVTSTPADSGNFKAIQLSFTP